MLLRFFSLFLFLCVFRFVWQSFFVFWLPGLSSFDFLFSLGKDLLRFLLFCLFILSVYFSWFSFCSRSSSVSDSCLISRVSFFSCAWSFLFVYALPCLFLLLLIVLSVFLWFSFDYGLMDWVVWVKYDWYPLLLFLSAIFLWWIASSSQLFSRLSLSCFFSRLWYAAILVIGLGVLFQLWKRLWPDFFFSFMGYGSLGDFFPGAAAPLYYLTGHDGVIRLSGLFAWPNVLWFFLVWFSGLFLYQLQRFRSLWKVIGILAYSFIVLLTLSRWAIVAYVLVLFLFLLFFASWRRKKFFYSILLVCFSLFSLWKIADFKSWSNMERGWWLAVSFDLLKENIWWYGPWFAGPARHYWEDYEANEKHPVSLLENIYLQTALNQWVLGLIFYLFFRLSILWQTGKVSLFQKEKNDLLLVFWFCLIALLAEWLVLHVWRDSMFNYLFLTTFGMLLWYCSCDAQAK